MRRSKQDFIYAIKYPVREYQKFQDYRHRQIQDEPTSLSPGLWSRLHPSLRQSYKFCLAGVASVWIMCFVFTIWVAVSRAAHKAEAGLVYILRTGSCATIQEINFWIHLLINILATGLYSVSSFVMQRLAAPTREDVDKAHSAKVSVRIGSLAMSNLGVLGRKRWAVFMSLVASSFPIHLVSNSLIVYSTTNAEWSSFVYLVAASDLNSLESDSSVLEISNPRQYNQLVPADIDNSTQSVQYIIHQKPPLLHLTIKDCIGTFGSGSDETWSDVLVLYNHETIYKDGEQNLKAPSIPGDSSFTKTKDSYLPDRSSVPWSWMCGAYSHECDVQTILQNDTWTIDQTIVTECRARKLPDSCELNVSLAIMILVLICITCKFVCIILAISIGRSQALLTIGDAIASFLQDPDKVWLHDQPPYTSRRKMVMVEMKDAFGTSTIFGLVCLSLAWSFFAFTFQQTRTAYTNSGTKFDFGTMLRFGFGKMPTLWTQKLRTLVLAYADAKNPAVSYTSGASLANLPQIALSAFYLLFNNYISRLFVAFELRSFSTRRRGLRVSQPAKDTKQRGAHFLQIPLRYGLLNMAIFTLLHTILSQTLFLRRVYAIYPQSFDDPNDIGKELISMIGYSPVSCFALAIVLSVLVASGIIMGLIPIDWRFPDTSGSSLAISAACHPPEGTQNTQQGEVRWGVMKKKAHNIVQCSFSLLPVRPPEVGERITIF
ncbi:hypothetical protein F4804DRAFT_349288 [Jackrogersella minutella]|nr:hypothetical protein F4804DRAFT_349288 [Jackrogersella minutella]